MSTVLRSIVTAVADVAIASGAERDALMPLIGNPTDERLPIAQLYELWERAVRTTQLTGLPIRVGSRAVFDRYGALGIALYVSGDNETALRRLCRYHDLLTDSGRWDTRVEGDDLIVRWTREGEPRLGLRLANEQVLASFATVLRQVTEVEQIREVRVAHAIPDLAEHTAHFKAPIRVTDENAVVLPARMLQGKPRAADPEIENFLITQIEAATEHAKDPIAAAVTRAIIGLLPDGVPTLDDIAPRLDTSERTLRRRLVDANTTYDQLLTGIQRERALVLLAGSYPIGEIALAVGFADPAGFSRAFKRWTGKTPSEARRQLSEKSPLPR
jgi:AraC-like DNA-binding protein